MKLTENKEKKKTKTKTTNEQANTEKKTQH